MSFWDDFRNSFQEEATKFVKGLAAAPGAVIEGATQAVVTKQTAPTLITYAPKQPSPIMQNNNSAVADLVEGSAEVTNKAIETLRLPYQYVAETAAGTVVSLNPNLPYFGKPASAIQAIRDDKTISIGQALATNLLVDAEEAKRIDWTNSGKPGLISIDDYFSKGKAKFLSGTFDTVANLTLDPLIIAGKAAKFARLDYLVRPTTKANQAQLTSEIDRAVAGDLTSPVAPLIDRIMQNPSASALIAEDLVTSSSAASNLIEALSIAGRIDRQAVGEVLKVGLGNAKITQELADRQPILKKKIEDVLLQNEQYNQILADPFNYPNVQLSTKRLLEENNKLVSQLRQQSKFLDATIGNELEAGSGVFASLGRQTWAKTSYLENLRGKVISNRNESLWAEGKVNVQNIPVRILSWINEGGIVGDVPSGVVKIEGIGAQESFREVVSNIRQIQAITGVSSNWARTKFDEFTSKITKAQRAQWLDSFDDEAMGEILISKLGINRNDEFLVKATLRFANALAKESKRMRTKFWGDLFDSNYTIVDDYGDPIVVAKMKTFVEDLAKESKISVKEMQNRLRNTPLNETQYANIHVLTDYKLFSDVIDENPQRFNMFLSSLKDLEKGYADIKSIKPNAKVKKPSSKDIDAIIEEARNLTYADGSLGEFTKGVSKTAVDGISAVLDIYYKTIWKPYTLLRFGYTQRNVLEGWARVIAATSQLSSEAGMNPFTVAKGLKDSGTLWTRDGVKIGAGRVPQNVANKIKAYAARKDVNKKEFIARARVAEQAVDTVENDIFFLYKELDDFTENSFLRTQKIDNFIKSKEFDNVLKSKSRDAEQISKLTQKIYNDINEALSGASKLIKNNKLDEIKIKQYEALVSISNQLNEQIIKYDMTRLARASVYDEMDKLAETATFRLVSAGQGKFEVVPSVEIPDAFAGILGQIARKDASGEKTMQTVIFGGGKQMGVFEALSRRTKSGIVNPDSKFWLGAYVEHINRRVYNDPLFQRFLNGETVDDVVKFLKSPSGANARENVEVAIKRNFNNSEKQFTEFLFLEFERLLPNNPNLQGLGTTLRDAARSGKMTESIARLIPEDYRPSIYGTELYPGKRSLAQFVDATVSTIFKYLGNLPEDKLVRHPFYRMVYQMEARRIAFQLRDQGIDLSRPDIINRIVQASHRRAYKTLNETLYTIDRYSNPAEFLRFVSPFYMAQQNSSRFWLGKTIQNPAVPYIGLLVWNSPNKIFDVRDAQGRDVSSSLPFYSNESIYIKMPDVIARNAFPGDERNAFLKLNKTSADLFFGGSLPVLPQLSGTLVDVPVDLFLRPAVEKVDFLLTETFGIESDALNRYVLPYYNPDTKVWNKIVPSNSWSRALVTSAMGDRSPQFQARVSKNLERLQYLADERGEALTPELMSKLTRQAYEQTYYAYRIEAIFGGVLPISTKVSNAYELMEQELKLYQSRYGYENGTDKYIEDNGIIKTTYLKSSTTYNPGGLIATPQTIRNLKSVKPELLDQISFVDESVLGAFFNQGTPADYTRNANSELREFKVLGKPLKSTMTDLEKQAKDRDAAAGNALFYPARDKILAQVKAEEIRIGAPIRPGSKAYEQFQNRMDMIALTVAQKYPEFMQRRLYPDRESTFKTVEAIYRLLSDKEYMEKVGADNKVAQGSLLWLEARETLAQELARRPSQNIKAASNEDILLRMQEIVDYMRLNGYSDFARFYDYNLTGDPLTPLGIGN